MGKADTENHLDGYSLIRNSMSANYGQPGGFSVNGYKNTTGSIFSRLGITAQGWGATSFYLRYEGEFRSDYIGQNINTGFRVPF